MVNSTPVISKFYTFEIECDNSEIEDLPESVSALISLTHEKAMEMGKFFAEEDPDSVDAYKSFGINSLLCDNLPATIFEFSDLSTFYFIWSKELKADCVQYYKRYKDKQNE